jgi:hypothetical protein
MVLNIFRHLEIHDDLEIHGLLHLYRCIQHLFLPALLDPQADPSAADQLLGELLGQNWRLELDAGLGGSLRPTENILLVGTR